jgi:hypothetical protein
MDCLVAVLIGAPADQLGADNPPGRRAAMMPQPVLLAHREMTARPVCRFSNNFCFATGW